MVGGGSRRRIACIDLSNRFYTIIPLSFGRSLPPVIETPGTLGLTAQGWGWADRVWKHSISQ